MEDFPQQEQDIVVGLTPVKGQVLITFLPTGAQVKRRLPCPLLHAVNAGSPCNACCSQVNAKPGENMGDAARRSGLNVPYGCKQGVCGTCEATQRQPTGQTNIIRVCSATVPKSNLDAPDREKMWGDLRGGKKSVAELRGTPAELTVTLANPNIALKRKEVYEKSKDAIASNTKDWLSPDYKSPGPGGPGAPPPPPPQKKGWF